MSLLDDYNKFDGDRDERIADTLSPHQGELARHPLLPLS